MRKKLYSIVILLVFLTSISNCQTIKYEGKDFILNGANVPWNSFGNDVGAGYNASWFENVFKNAEINGVNCLRLWIHCDGRITPWFTSTGYIRGIHSLFYSSFDDIFQRAQNHHIMIMPCLWSFDMTNANHADLIQDSLKTQSYIDSILTPLVKRYANQTNLLAWEIINEPEWSMSVNGGGSTTQKVSAKEMQRFVGMQAATIHKNSKKMVTVGSASLKWNSTAPNCIANYWSDSVLIKATNDTSAYLDFYQIHYYNWMYPYYDPFDSLKPLSYWKLDKPVIIGECPGNDFRHPASQMLEQSFANNFAGVLFWSIAANDGVSTASDFYVHLSDFRINHFDSIAFSSNSSEKLSKDSIFIISTNALTLQVDSNSSKKLYISSTIPWKIINSGNWLKVDPDTFNTSATITVTSLSANADIIKNRIDTLTISAIGKPIQKIVVTQDHPVLNVQPKKVVLPRFSTNYQSFTITSNLQWKITGRDSTWFDVYPLTGTGNKTITVVSTSRNDSVFTKTAKLTITNNNAVAPIYITISQLGIDTILTVSNNSLTLPDSITSTNISIASNVDWNVTYDSTWLQVNPTSGKLYGTITIKTKLNDGFSRNSIVTVSAKNPNSNSGTKNQKISISQQGPLAYDYFKNINEYVYPNPAKDNIRLHVESDVDFQIYSIKNELVFYKRVSRNEMVPINYLSKGIYFTKIILEKGIINGYLIVE